MAVCSTTLNLEKQRNIVYEALAANNCIATSFPFPNPTDPYLWKLCLRAIAECDFCVILIGDHYGALNQSGVGYVHQALSQASAFKKPIHSLIYSGMGRSSLNADDQNRLQLFTQGLTKTTLHSFWRDDEQLRDVCEGMVESMLDKYDLKGWLPANQVNTAQAQTKQDTDLKKQVELLTAALKKEREKNLHSSADFEQQSQLFEMPYQCNAFRGGTLIKVEESCQLGLKTYFDMFASSLSLGCTSSKIRNALNAFLQKNEIEKVKSKVKKAHAITQMQADEDHFEKLLLALRAYGLIKVEGKVWTLTSFGEHLALKTALKWR
ncbi:DUF4062 domain-containing protein [Marinicellulosiphila megalodicopiae]|uniref:DUF4062 domain-containing protein n=1 Tax=Marinicellulosiphila megalodicopiae TaxID=2724896 RepID=UPI003BAE4489